jgi:hypothetical protein
MKVSCVALSEVSLGHSIFFALVIHPILEEAKSKFPEINLFFFFLPMSKEKTKENKMERKQKRVQK